MRATMLAPALALLCLALVSRSALAGPLDAIPDSEITADEFDDTIAFTPDDDADAAEPPLEVHAVDPEKATAAGAKKLVDGKVWLDADDYERNDILNTIDEDLPKDTEVVIDVSTGDIWQVPLAFGVMLPDGVRAWTSDEYDWLDESWDAPRLTKGPLTRKKFLTIGGIEDTDPADAVDELRYLHSFGQVGYREIKSMQGLQVAAAVTWLRETPVQRYLRLVMLNNYLSRFPQFQGKDNQLVFALMVPDGALYALPYFQYRYMLARSGIQPWSLYDMAMLPVVLTIFDRQIRGDRFVVERTKEP
jgi:hypothetical protein